MKLFPRRRTASLLGAGILAVLAAGQPAANAATAPKQSATTGAAITAPATAAAPLPARLAHVGTANQVIVVTASSTSTSYAWLQAWQKSSTGKWTKVMSTPARVGARGMTLGTVRRQGSNTTPMGTYGISQAFGVKANPGAKLPYLKASNRDWWAYDPRCPKTYNRLVKGTSSCWRTSWAEHLVDYSRQYAYAAVIGYNLPTATKAPRLTGGGGIFLHVMGRGATAGCVSVEQAKMASLLRWMKPGVKIVIGTKANITRM